MLRSPPAKLVSFAIGDLAEGLKCDDAKEELNVEDWHLWVIEGRPTFCCYCTSFPDGSRSAIDGC